MRLLLVVDYWGYTKGLARNTVSQYISSTKTHYTQQEVFGHKPAAVWQEKGKHHPLLSAALKGIPPKHRQETMKVDADWFKDGFLHSWSTLEYVAVTFIYSWMLRICEATLKAETAHTVMWSMVKFKIKIPNGGMQEMQGRELRTTPCDMVELDMDTRKHQEQAREMPGRMNMRHIPDPSQGATTWQGMCQATMLQGWALMRPGQEISGMESDQTSVGTPWRHATTADPIRREQRTQEASATRPRTQRENVSPCVTTQRHYSCSQLQGARLQSSAVSPHRPQRLEDHATIHTPWD